MTYPYSLRMSSPGAPLFIEAVSNQATRDQLVNAMALSQAGVYMSLPVKEASPLQVIMPWRPDLLLTSARYNLGEKGAPIHKGNFSSSAANATGGSSGIHLGEQSAVQAENLAIKMSPHQVVEHDLLSVRMQWSQENGAGRMLFPLVRGAPYITGLYSGLCPALYTGHAILTVNDENVPASERDPAAAAAASGGKTCSNPHNRHHITLNSGLTVLVYLDRPACATWDRNRVVFQRADGTVCSASEWVMRVAILPANLPLNVLRNRVGILDAFRASIPLSGSVSFARDGADSEQGASSTMRFAWRSYDISKKGLSLDTASVDSGKLVVSDRAEQLPDQGLLPCELLMLQLPHQSAIVKNARNVDLQFDSLKGPLKANVGQEWLLHLRHSPATHSFTAPSPPLSSARPEWRRAVEQSLRHDVAFSNISSETADPYGFGKEVARLARLALIADEIGGEEFQTIATECRNKLKNALEPWMHGKNTDPLEYDSQWHVK